MSGRVRVDHGPSGFTFSWAKHGDVAILQSNLHDRRAADRIRIALADMLVQEWAERTKAPDFVPPDQLGDAPVPPEPAPGPFNSPRVVKR